MKTIVYVNPKGGTGKTSLSVITAKALTQTGKRVLFIDTDPQNSATYFLTQQLHAQTLYMVYAGDPLKENIVPTRWGFDLVPSEVRLMFFADMSPSHLKQELMTVADDYDYCIIDAAPYFNVLMRVAITAADTIVIPTTVDVFGHKCVHMLMDAMSKMDMAGKELIIVLTMWQPEKASDNVFNNRLGDMFRKDKRLGLYLAETHIYRSRPIQRIMVEKDYKIMALKALQTITAHVAEVTGCGDVHDLMEVG